MIGYYEFEECEGTSPTLGMEIGQTYTFVQSDISNFMHPLGFAYFADGAHADLPELEPGVSVPDGANCASSLSCPAPMYYKNGEYLGVYNNMPPEISVQQYINDTDFGLDAYEPDFFRPLPDWAAEEYSVKLTFGATYWHDIFYFCHVREEPQSQLLC
jgi:hypothetical protein